MTTIATRRKHARPERRAGPKRTDGPPDREQPLRAVRPRQRSRTAAGAPSPTPSVPAESVQSAREAGLVHVSDARPGLRRVRTRTGFRYVDAEGKAMREAPTLARIRALAIPPAWTRVWICPVANGHLQATGRDARGRKQYRYHARWRDVRDEDKFGRLTAFAHALPKIRRRVGADLAKPGLPREKVLATVVRLLETTFIRVGNERYARENGSFGLTTLRNRHVRVRGGRIAFAFRGKSGKEHRIELEDARLARILRRCRELPGYELFQYVDEDGQARSIGSSDVNDYLREICGDDYTAKDFRTWAGTVLMVLALKSGERPDTAAQCKRVVNAAIADVAHHLGNTVAVCRKCYIHPHVVEAFVEATGAPPASNPYARPELVAARWGRALEREVVRLLESRRRASRRTRDDDLASTLARSLEATRPRAGGARAGAPAQAT